jgi:phosphoenolpyruvate synthase/pyruvate phosphate dikinase
VISKHVYFFGGGKAEGNATMKNLLGDKGANLAEMTNLGIPVPPGFTITSDVCEAFCRNNRTFPKDLDTEVRYALARLEKLAGRKLGDPKDPLLVSVRPSASSCAVEAVLNLGLNDESAAGLAQKTGNPRFAWEAYRHFLQQYGKTVLGADAGLFEQADAVLKAALCAEMTAEQIKELANTYKKMVRAAVKQDFPQRPHEQLWEAVGAIFGGEYRAAGNHSRYGGSLEGTAVIVQTMVFGNCDSDSGAGRCFSRNPVTGRNEFCGEYRANAQTADAAAVRTPQKLAELQNDSPALYKQLAGIKKRLEKHFGDIQDMEFTVQRGKLYLLQSRSAKRSGAAAVKSALDMVKEKLIDKEQAVMRVMPEHLDELAQPLFAEAAQKTGAANAVPSKLPRELETFLGWCDEVRNDSVRGEVKGFRIRVNAGGSEDTKRALDFGADGAGLYRTEPLFFEAEQLLHFQAMLLSDAAASAAPEAAVTEAAKERKTALKKILPFQRKELSAFFKVMDGRPAAIRLLDSPLCAFLPRTGAAIHALAALLDRTEEEARTLAGRCAENPAFAFRGCRLAVIYPEIYDMQAEAIALAAADCIKKNIPVHPEIMIPFVCDPGELALLRPRIQEVWLKAQNKTGADIPFRFGAIIETPRAAFLAKEIAAYADFFSFRINKLTRMLFACGPEETPSFIPAYLEKNLLKADPFKTIDERSAGALLKMAVDGGREMKPGLKCGLCGGQDGDAIDFCYRAGLNYVSCPPNRVLTARLSGARAVLNNS